MNARARVLAALVLASAAIAGAWTEQTTTGAKPAPLARSRHTNLLTLGEKYKGRFNPEVMMEVLDIPWNKGGAMRSRNIYEVVYTPKDLVIWLRTPDFSDWEKVDLKQHSSVE